MTQQADVLKAQVVATTGSESRTLVKTIRAFTRPIVTRRLDSPKRCTWTQMVGMPIIRVAHEAADLKVLAVPLTCPMRWSAEGCHGHSRTTPQASRSGLANLSRVPEET